MVLVVNGSFELVSLEASAPASDTAALPSPWRLPRQTRSFPRAIMVQKFAIAPFVGTAGWSRERIYRISKLLSAGD